MLDQVLAWAAVNSAARATSTGSSAWRPCSPTRSRRFRASSALVEAPPVEAVDSAGRAIEIAHGRHLHLKVRPEAPLQLLFTGHMDTVFAPDHPFQDTRWLDEATINGPGTADMKGGIAVMLAALQGGRGEPGRGAHRL